MDVIRLILLLVLLGGLTLLLVQNLSPVLPLVFLGMRTQPLPLALWILSSTVAGACTSVLLTNLSKLVNYSTRVSQTTRYQSPPPFNRPEPTSPQTNHQPKYDQDDDWETNQDQDDWDVAAQPETSSSGYSYSYQDPRNTSVGKTESIYDADYRVIIPPHKPPTTESTDEDDWGFFAEDDDFPHTDPPPRR